jgi:hypothetical protein
MFWFPEPEQPDPEVLEFLAAEKEYLTGDWTLAKVLMSLLARPVLWRWPWLSGNARSSMD